MNTSALRLPGDSLVPELAERIEAAGGRLIVVGGWVRDALLGRIGHDLDLEIFGLDPAVLTELLVPLGFSPPVGRQFATWRHARAGLDVARARAGNELFERDRPDSIVSAFAQAARHRDLTINAIGWLPRTNRLIDPLGGRSDLAARILRAADERTFGSDPLRVLRVARLAAQFDAHPEPRLTSLCRTLALNTLPVERVAGELRRILCEPPRPSRAFECLRDLEQLAVFPPVASLAGVPQDPRWHPEGDVLVHTLMVVDRARTIASDEHLAADALTGETLLWAALCHDLGKAETTRREPAVASGAPTRVRALGHEAASARRAEHWLSSLRLPRDRVRAVAALVLHHLAPAQFVAQGAGLRAYRRLARKVAAAGVTLADLERLARADHLGRTTEEARAGRFEAGRRFLAEAARAQVRDRVADDVVSAADVMRLGVPAGRRLGRILAHCREIQDETGSRDAGLILARALKSDRGADHAPDSEA